MGPDHFLDHGNGEEDKEQEGHKSGHGHSSSSPLLFPDAKLFEEKLRAVKEEERARRVQRNGQSNECL